MMIFLNGTMLPAHEALISVDERGFRFGDGVFETIAVHSGIPYLLEYHMERLEAGLRSLHMHYAVSEIPAAIRALVARNGVERGIVRVYISRGIGSQGYLPATPSPQPTLLIQTLPMPDAPAQAVSLWLSSWEKISPRALPVQYKLAQGVNATLARMEARDKGCFDALQLSADGFVSEASSANIFWFKDNTLFTPSLKTGALAGVTRRRIMEFAPCEVVEGEFPVDDLAAAECVFLTNSSYGVLPVTYILPIDIEWKNSDFISLLAAVRTQDIYEYIAERV